MAPASLLALLLTLLLSACSPIQSNVKRLESMHAAGEYEQAAAFLDEPRIRKEYSRHDQILWELDRGAVALALNDPATALATLESAELNIERNRELSSDQRLSRWLLNDTVSPFTAAAYEDIYLNVLKLCAQLEQGNVEGGATVEARRAAWKADTRRDQYLKDIKAARWDPLESTCRHASLSIL